MQTIQGLSVEQRAHDEEHDFVRLAMVFHDAATGTADLGGNSVTDFVTVR